jgi:hypothetical protein
MLTVDGLMPIASCGGHDDGRDTSLLFTHSQLGASHLVGCANATIYGSAPTSDGLACTTSASKAAEQLG